MSDAAIFWGGALLVAGAGTAIVWGAILFAGRFAGDAEEERPFIGELDGDEIPPPLPPELEAWRRPRARRRAR